VAEQKEPNEIKKSPSDRYYIRLAIRIAFDFGFSIAIPAVVAALIGIRLDRKLDTEPWMLVLLLITAFLSTSVWLVKKANYYKTLYDSPRI
jgi:F0F1-type ATP synthase assembly protein I